MMKFIAISFRNIPFYPVSILYFLFVLSFVNCSVDRHYNASTTDHPPEWASSAIWYQIFPERFRNGDSTNDPTLESLRGSWPFETTVRWDARPDNWQVTPWSGDWYMPDPYFRQFEDTSFYYGIQSRRYGGDLQGVLDKLDYLENLGINAIYFNPLNDSPSLHKYDAANYRHIDRHFGPDPEEDLQIMNREAPQDPSTWEWTNADKLFLELIQACHQRGIRIIMDYSWNHTGINFWAFRDVMENGRDSKFTDWYYIREFDDPSTSDNEFDYKAWFGARTLPELKENIVGHHHEGEPLQMIEGNFADESLKDHIFHVTKRWLDPNGDGDPKEGIDGLRLDVAVEVPMGFWREYRKFVKSINPEAYLVGEIWWEQWPDKLIDPAPFLVEVFDAVMNYRWYREARRLFAQAGNSILPSVFVHRIDSMNQVLDSTRVFAMMNVGATHDTPRLSTSLFNKNRYKYQSTPRDSDYKVQKPDNETRRIQMLFLLHQFTFPGAPHIYYGDEVGMWGADDPDCRKPMLWNDIQFDQEIRHPANGHHSEPIPVKPDIQLLEYYTRLISLRKNHSVFARGSIRFILADDEQMILAYERKEGNSVALAVFNISSEDQIVKIPISGNASYQNLLEAEILYPESGAIEIGLRAQSGKVFLKE